MTRRTVNVRIGGEQGAGKTNTAEFLATALKNAGVDVIIYDSGGFLEYKATRRHSGGLPDFVRIDVS